ncbi:MAG TPA: LamG-like jellyroll fold domain-containing protein [Planctomycetota bacterium]|nr:LamG-like jellyroll fold domain-containing protein [Planctomycetota bacterium]
MGWRLGCLGAIGLLVLAGSTAVGHPFPNRFSPAITPIAGMVGYWPLDETTSPSMDFSGNGNNGNWQNGPARVAPGAPGLTFTNPGCLSLNGTNQFVDLGNPAIFPTGKAPRSLCGWGKSATTAGGYRWIFAYGTGGTSQAMFIGMNGPTLYGGGYGDDITVNNFWDMNWHHIALTYDGTTAILYADGVQVASAAKNWNLVANLAYIGRQVNTAAEFWNGQIDDVRLYSRVLTPVEVAVLAAGCPTPTGLTATFVNSQVSLSWTAPTGPAAAYTYNIKRGTSPGTEATIATGVAGTTYTDSSAAFGQTYYYVVTAISAAESGPSNEASCTTVPISVSPTSLTVVEAGGTATFTVSLLLPLNNLAPLSTTATVNFTSPSAPVLLSNGGGFATSLPISFTGDGTSLLTNTITVKGVDDFIAANPWTATITFSTTSSTDGRFNGDTLPPVTVNQTESDFPGILVTPSSGLSTTNGGPSISFTVQLLSKPTANVSIPLSVSIPYEATATGPGGLTTLTFMPSTWNLPQTVTVTPQAVDATTTYITSYEVDFTPVSSGDKNYSGFPLPPVPIFEATSTPPLKKVWKCGLLGLEGLVPLFFGLAWRRRRRNR